MKSRLLKRVASLSLRTKRILTLALCLTIVLSLALPLGASAQKAEPKTVRVGWYESAFHRTDPFGRRSGYGYEYQQRIATYTGWKYEYVEGSWSELLEKLIAGEIDLLSDVSYTEERAQKILYSAEAMGSEGYHVFIAPDNTEIRPDDFSTLNGKRIGVNKNSIQEKLFIDWAKSHNVSPEIVESTEKTPVLLEKLANGEFDALVTLDTYGNTADVVPVCKVGFAYSYFGVNKNRPDLKQDLDVAMNRIFEDNRDFNQQLTEKFNKGSFFPDKLYYEYFTEARDIVQKRLMKFMKSGGLPAAIDFERNQLEIINVYLSRMSNGESAVGEGLISFGEDKSRRAYGTA